jgi:outer membrane receptor protein involved in Fe transport
MLLWALSTAFAQIPQSQRSVAEVLEELRADGLQIVYSSQLLPPSVRVQSPILATGPLEIAREVLAPHGLELAEVSNGVFAVKRSSDAVIKGRIVDSRDGASVRDVRISIRPGNRTFRTDSNGEFVIPLPSSSSSPPTNRWNSRTKHSFYRLVVNAAGYRPVELPMDSSQRELLLQLEPHENQMDATIVTAQRYPFSVKAADNSLPLAGAPLLSQASLGDDPIRALSRLPGVAQNGGAGSLNIRGGAANEVLILLDGFQLRQAFHMPGYRSLLSIFDPSAVKSVDVYTGAMPARFGGRMSGVLDIQSIDVGKKPSRAIGIGFLSARVHADKALTDHSSVLTATRYGSSGYLQDAIAPARGHPSYGDTFNRFQFRLNDATEVTLNALLSRDSLTIHREGFNETSDLDSQLAYVWARSKSTFSEQVTWSNWGGYTYIAAQRTGLLNSPQLAVGALHEDRRSTIWDVRSLVNFAIGDTHAIEAGAKYSRGQAHYQYDSRVAFGPLITDRFGVPISKSQAWDLLPSRDDFSIFISDRWNITPQLTGRFGLRTGNAEGSGEGTVLDPRVAFTYAAAPTTSLRAAWGRVHQFPDISEFVVEDGMHADQSAQRTDYTVLSLEQKFKRAMSVRLEGYKKKQYDVRASQRNILSSPTLLPELSFDRMPWLPRQADLQGIELYLQQTLKAWSWRLAYSWSEARERIGSREYARDWDQRHFATLGVEWRKGAWLVSSAGTVRSGRPTTTISNLPEGGILIGPRNGYRLDTYFGIDLRVAWHRAFASGTLAAAIQATNLFDRRTACCSELGIQSDTDGDPHIYVKSGETMPLVPWASLSWSF